MKKITFLNRKLNTFVALLVLWYECKHVSKYITIFKANIFMEEDFNLHFPSSLVFKESS